ncbi:PemK/MazF family toxin [Halorhabdus sp. SVX81]|nr:hypothetical protein [Halorhabdus sp. SVX81]WEL18764.1 PemK/MazF family toxin [Halorhabdus sp. SVX81]
MTDEEAAPIFERGDVVFGDDPFKGTKLLVRGSLCPIVRKITNIRGSHSSHPFNFIEDILNKIGRGI